MSTVQLSSEQLRQALQLSEQIEQLQQQLNSILNGTGGPTPAGAASTSGDSSLKGRKLSPATLRKMRAPQQARWAKIRGEKGSPAAKSTSAPATTAPKAKKRGKLTPEGRAKLAAAMKARWAARKLGAAAPNAKA